MMEDEMDPVDSPEGGEEVVEPLDQPDDFDLELELLRWVKWAVNLPVTPCMQKPSGLATQYYGLDSKSRWREAVCVMMLLSEPNITSEGVSKLGRQMASLFRQDPQLWEVKAVQLTRWVERGLLNVKLLDRTLAYFQNQSSFLQYIKTLKRPLPKIESPGFPGTQWNEFYWKDQTVMLLMQEADFPQGKNPEFCARLFKEEPGKWRLKMEQFKRWLEKGKHDPLPEYYGTGKNCAECGVFLWDTRSYLKHMKRNHGYKIKEKDRILINKEMKNNKQEKSKDKHSDRREISPGLDDSLDSLGPIDGKYEATKSPLSIHSKSDSPLVFDDLYKEKLMPSSPLNAEGSEISCTPQPLENVDSLLMSEDEIDDKPARIESQPKESILEPVGEEVTHSRRRAASSKSPKDEPVFCPNCNHKTVHSKIISHLKRCTKKMTQGKRSPRKYSPRGSKHTADEDKDSDVDEATSIPEPETKKSKDSNNVKNLFLKKFEAQNQQEREKDKSLIETEEIEKNLTESNNSETSEMLPDTRESKGSNSFSFDPNSSNIDGDEHTEALTVKRDKLRKKSSTEDNMDGDKKIIMDKINDSVNLIDDQNRVTKDETVNTVNSSVENVQAKEPPKKRGRKPKNKPIYADTSSSQTTEQQRKKEKLASIYDDFTESEFTGHDDNSVALQHDKMGEKEPLLANVIKTSAQGDDDCPAQKERELIDMNDKPDKVDEPSKYEEDKPIIKEDKPHNLEENEIPPATLKRKRGRPSTVEDKSSSETIRNEMDEERPLSDRRRGRKKKDKQLTVDNENSDKPIKENKLVDAEEKCVSPSREEENERAATISKEDTTITSTINEIANLDTEINMAVKNNWKNKNKPSFDNDEFSSSEQTYPRISKESSREENSVNEVKEPSLNLSSELVHEEANVPSMKNTAEKDESLQESHMKISLGNNGHELYNTEEKPVSTFKEKYKDDFSFTDTKESQHKEEEYSRRRGSEHSPRKEKKKKKHKHADKEKLLESEIVSNSDESRKSYPPLKLKFSRKECSTEKALFEVRVESRPMSELKTHYQTSDVNHDNSKHTDNSDNSNKKDEQVDDTPSYENTWDDSSCFSLSKFTEENSSEGYSKISKFKNRFLHQSPDKTVSEEEQPKEQEEFPSQPVLDSDNDKWKTEFSQDSDLVSGSNATPAKSSLPTKAAKKELSTYLPEEVLTPSGSQQNDAIGNIEIPVAEKTSGRGRPKKIVTSEEIKKPGRGRPRKSIPTEPQLPESVATVDSSTNEENLTVVESPLNTTVPKSPIKTTVPDSPIKTTAFESPTKTTFPESPLKKTVYGSPIKPTVHESHIKTTVHEKSAKTTVLESPMKTTVLDNSMESTALDSSMESSIFESPLKTKSVSDQLTVTDAVKDISMEVNLPLVSEDCIPRKKEKKGGRGRPKKVVPTEMSPKENLLSEIPSIVDNGKEATLNGERKDKKINSSELQTCETVPPVHIPAEEKSTSLLKPMEISPSKDEPHEENETIGTIGSAMEEKLLEPLPIEVESPKKTKKPGRGRPKKVTSEEPVGSELGVGAFVSDEETGGRIKGFLETAPTAEGFDDERSTGRSRGRKMIPCPLCGVEYAIASNLEKHIDKDHKDGVEQKRKSREKIPKYEEKAKKRDQSAAELDSSSTTDLSPAKKQKTELKEFKEEFKDREEAGSGHVEPESEIFKEEPIVAPPDLPKVGNTIDTAELSNKVDDDKPTEYEIFQKLQMKDPKDKKKTECPHCGISFGFNTIKRHLAKHEKEELKTQSQGRKTPEEKENKGHPKIACPECDKLVPNNCYSRHLLKHKKEADKKENESVVKDKEVAPVTTEELPAEDRIPCDQCGKMLPKNAMKRHLMKHEIVTQDSDTEKIVSLPETSDTNGSAIMESKETPLEAKPLKPGKGMKKVPCEECGLSFAKQVIKRHMEAHRKQQVKQQERYAPIEITPTKEYHEYAKEQKSSRSAKSDLSKSMDKAGEDQEEPGPSSTPQIDKKQKTETAAPIPVNKIIKDLKETEKAKVSEDESETENPLEAAVRKVVSYRMTPKQALSIYNLTPKVLFDNLLGETDADRMSILTKVNLSHEGEKRVIAYCKENEAQLSYKAVINCVRELKLESGDGEEFSLSRLEAYRWWYAFRKKFDLKITAKKK